MMKRLLFAMLAGLALNAEPAIIAPLPVTLQNGTTADANQVMSNFNAIVNNVNSNAAPLATTPQTNTVNTFTQPQIVPNATALTHAVNAGQIQQNNLTYFTDTGAANAYVATPAPAWTSYTAGAALYVKIANANTGTSTINVNALGVKNILNQDGSNLEANALRAGNVYGLLYDGTQFELVNKALTAPTQANGDNSTKLATTAYAYALVPPGTVLDYAGATVPGGFLLADGSAVSRSTYASLLTATTVVQTCTTANASAVVSACGSTADMVPGASVEGSGIQAGSVIISVDSATQFTMNLTATASATVPLTTFPWGNGNGSTTFNLPPLVGRYRFGAGPTAGTQLAVDSPGQVNTAADTFAVPTNNTEWITGQTVVFTTTGTAPAPLVNTTTYYIVRNAANTVQLATSLANAQNGTIIDLTTQGTGTHTLTYSLTQRRLGELAGEEAHAQSSTELLSHTHTQNAHSHQVNTANGAGGTSSLAAPTNNTPAVFTTSTTTAINLNTGGNAAANIMPPSVGVKPIIKF